MVKIIFDALFYEKLPPSQSGWAKFPDKEMNLLTKNKAEFASGTEHYARIFTSVISDIV